ncbi:hypothetical protein O6H91_01G042600 [Diphasiastrum complanatum]|uniref:Uncharacterized protein n=1 Tax=Diphasiastrum complanatum TaxID=34168 RepID=A0ACC2EQ83_DIPCM|nr:hypothetical protein O6H91_01G042600 [Diphasiastrum complanatum]
MRTLKNEQEILVERASERERGMSTMQAMRRTSPARWLLKDSQLPSISGALDLVANNKHFAASHADVRHVSTLPTRGGLISPKGTGGRSSVSGVVATVFGATGFLGRYVVQLLAKTGSQVMVPFRGLEDSHRHLKLMGDLGQIVPMKYDIRDEESIRAAIAKSNVVINLIGKENETRNFSFEDINVDIPDRLSQLAHEHGGIMRFIQVSCLGASHSSPSKSYRTKAIGEELTVKNFPGATILRPAVMFGTEDRFLNRWAIQAKKLPALPIIAGGKTKLQPALVLDVAAAVVAAVRDEGTSVGKTYELGGPDVLTVNELVHIMFDTIREHPHVIDVPLSVAKLMAAPQEYLLKKVPFPLSPVFPFYSDYVHSLEVDSIVSPEALGFTDLGIKPRKLQGIAIDYLLAYRAGGPFMGSTVGERTAGAGF